MEYPIIAFLTLSLVVRCWPGQPTPQWIQTWIDRLWLLLGLAWVLGIALAFLNATSTTLPNGGYRFSMSTPRQIQYLLVTISLPLAILSVLGAIHIARFHVKAMSQQYGAEKGSARRRFRELGISLVAALAAIGVSWKWGGPLVMTSKEGYSNIFPFIVDLAAAFVFFVALAWAWKAVSATPQK